MPQLIKKIEGVIFDNPIGDVKNITNITGQVQYDDYINLNGHIAFLQNLSKVQDSYMLISPVNFGLKNTFNLEIQTIEISY